MAVLTLLTVGVSLAAIPLPGQASTATTKKDVSSEHWTLSRTPWGDPDLQGIWDTTTTTPLQQGHVITGGSDLNVVFRVSPPRQLERQPALIVDPPDGHIPLSSEAIQRLKDREEARRDRGVADSWLDRSVWERCITRALPDAMFSAYNSNFQILQTPEYVAILIEMIHETRMIPLDGRPHVGAGIRQWMGDSRGQWEGDTLVVETTNFNSKLDGGEIQPSYLMLYSHQGSGETLRLVERFTPVDAHTIDYRLTVDDPKVLTRPYTVALPMRNDGTPDRIFEYACHEGNIQMENLLKGARADEDKALQDARRAREERLQAGHPGVR